MDTPIEGMPEFGKPEEIIPLVVPDVPDTSEKFPAAPGKNRCKEYIQAKNKQCEFPPRKGMEYCTSHAIKHGLIPKDIVDGWRKLKKGPRLPKAAIQKLSTPTEIVAFVQHYVSQLLERFHVPSLEVAQVLADLLSLQLRAQKAIREEKAEQDDGKGSWRMKGAAV